MQVTLIGIRQVVAVKLNAALEVEEDGMLPHRQAIHVGLALTEDIVATTNVLK